MKTIQPFFSLKTRCLPLRSKIHIKKLRVGIKVELI